MTKTVLIVDDESAVRRVLSTTLRALGFEVVASSRGEEALSLLGVSKFDAILLDINMPGLGGIAVCRAVRRIAPTVPILMLTVRDEENDKVEALEAGADDYITKPFAIRELVARINAVMRRSTETAPVSPSMTIGEVTLCSATRTFSKRGLPIHLTPKEFDIVEHLMRSHGKPVTHTKILSSIWGHEYRNHVEYLRTYIRQLRKLIEDDPAHPRYLLTVPYIGYRFRD